MTATATATRTGRAHPATVRPDAALSFPGVVRSELIKSLSLRSTYWTVFGLGFAIVGVAVLFLVSGDVSSLPGQTPGARSLATATNGVVLAQIAAVLIGAFGFSGEYATGMVTSTFAAVPRRLPVLAAKAIVVFLISFGATAVSVLIAWAITQPKLAAAGSASGLTENGLAQALFATCVGIGLVAVFALGLGATLRSSAGAITVVLTLILVIPALLALGSGGLPILGDILTFWISTAATTMGTIPTEGQPLLADGVLAPWLGGVVVLAWTTVSLTVASVLLRSRDA